jgi:Predicted ester cyclase
MTQESELKTRVREAWHAAWDDGDMTVLDGLLSEAFVRSTYGSAASLNSTELKESIEATRAAFPDLTTTIDSIIEENGQLAIFWSSTGTHRSELFGVPATNRTIETNGCNLCGFENGKMTRERVTWDPRQLLRALGITSLGED